MHATLATRRLVACLLPLTLLMVATGCQGSRWAREDPTYAAKYDHHTDNPVKMAKQAIDARHLAGHDGVYTGLAMRDEPVGVGAQVGYFSYPDVYLKNFKGAVETRVGLGGLVTEGDYGVSGGLDLGLRLQTPTRLAPFVGVGGYAGYVPLAPDDGRDNDGDGFIDEDDEDNTSFVGAIYPEAGAHFWLTPQWRLTASASHYLTTDSSQSDFTLYGISLARVRIPSTTIKRPASVPPVCTAEVTPSESKTWPSEPWSPPTAAPAKPVANQPVTNPYSGLDLPAVD